MANRQASPRRNRMKWEQNPSKGEKKCEGGKKQNEKNVFLQNWSN